MSKLTNGIKGVQKAVENKINIAKSILSSPKNRAILGIICMGLGSGLLLSAYIPLPNE